mmetsp:Transcript_32507/g.67799  ORF Transcript_32507/g.67799 Transcript_32507/m.67799 type:complete len:261 (-) Transcript_32507:175-957(-)
MTPAPIKPTPLATVDAMRLESYRVPAKPTTEQMVNMAAPNETMASVLSACLSLWVRSFPMAPPMIPAPSNLRHNRISHAKESDPDWDMAVPNDEVASAADAAGVRALVVVDARADCGAKPRHILATKKKAKHLASPLCDGGTKRRKCLIQENLGLAPPVLPSIDDSSRRESVIVDRIWCWDILAMASRKDARTPFRTHGCFVCGNVEANMDAVRVGAGILRAMLLLVTTAVKACVLLTPIAINPTTAKHRRRGDIFTMNR